MIKLSIILAFAGCAASCGSYTAPKKEVPVARAEAHSAPAAEPHYAKPKDGKISGLVFELSPPDREWPNVRVDFAKPAKDKDAQATYLMGTIDYGANGTVDYVEYMVDQPVEYSGVRISMWYTHAAERVRGTWAPVSVNGHRLPMLTRQEIQHAIALHQQARRAVNS